MTIATTRPSEWTSDIEELDPPTLNLRPVSGPPAAPVDDVAVDPHRTPAPFKGDPQARNRWATKLHEMTGWEFPEISADREYVSRLWAEDWDSPEDSVYDNG